MVLHNAVVETGATVGANAVVTNNMIVPAGALAVGVPASIKEGKSSLVGIENGRRALRLERQALRHQPRPPRPA